jgi:predicted hydrocarbon binding protein
MAPETRVSFETEGFVLFMDSLRETFGLAGESMLFHMSKQYGKYLIQSAKNSYKDAPEHNQVMMDKHLEKVQSLGWGKMKFDKMDWVNGEFTISLLENTFSDYCVSGKDGVCYFIKGVMAGTIEEITGQPFNINVQGCVKDGDSNCVFKLKKMNYI